MTLHTVNLLPDHADCERCIAQLSEGDAVLFLGRGVWIANARASWTAAWQKPGVSLHALRPDLESAGLSSHLAAGIQLEEMDGFVRLTEAHSKQRAWF
jgi:tRNA 2-thiouridine synthesizing protein B